MKILIKTKFYLSSKYSGSCFYKSRYVGSRDNGTIYVTNGDASESLLANAVARFGFENIQIYFVKIKLLLLLF